MKRISKIWYVVGVIILIAVVSWLWPDSKKKEEVSFVTEKVAPANIQNSITATGSIEPVTEVTVGTQVSGIISKIYVDYNSEVKKGQVIAELEKLGRPDIVVIAGGVIPVQDYDFLYKAGVAAIFGPGTSVTKAACQIMEILLGE